MVCRTSTPVPASRFPRRQHSASVLRAISDLVWRARWPDPGFVRVGGLPDACAARALKATKDLSRGFPNLSPVPAWRFPRREDLAYVLWAISDVLWRECWSDLVSPRSAGSLTPVPRGPSKTKRICLTAFGTPIRVPA
jgi:hypothetical protein